MPSGFKSFGEEEFDRVFMKETEIIDRFVGKRLWSWGLNRDGGPLGDGSTTSRSSPGTTVGGGVNWASVATSFGYDQTAGFVATNYAAGIKTDGTLWTWGDNYRGQLGDGTTTARSSPDTVAGGGTTWKAVSMGYRYSLAIKTDGTLWSWGQNDYGQLGNGNTTSRSSPGSASAVSSTTGWKSISAGHIHAGAIKGDGSLLMWGANSYGGIGDGTTTDRTVPVGPSGAGTNWKQISAGYYFSAAVKTDGTLWTWGYNDYGQLGDNTTTNRSSPGTTLGNSTWKSVAAGSRVALGIAD